MSIVAKASLLATLAVAAQLLEAQAPANNLPPAAKQFMESEQLQRWARMIQLGDSLFNKGSCMRCHAVGGKGTERGPNLSDSTWVQSDGGFSGIFETIFWGVRRRDFNDKTRRFEMNPAGGMNLEWDQMRALTVYVWSLSNGNFLAQR